MEDEEHSEGQGMGVLKYFIIFIVVVLIIFLFYGKLWDLWKGSADAQACRKSVEAHAMSDVAGTKIIDTVKCAPTTEIIEDTDRNIIMKKTADLMAQCFWKLGANEFDLFSGGIMGKLKVLRYCAVCSQIKFKGGAKGQKIPEFRKYLMTTAVPSKYGNDISYAQYLIGRPTTPGEFEPVPLPNQIEIDTNQEYGIMYLYVKDEHVSEAVASLLGAGTGSLIGYAGGIYLTGGIGLAPMTIAVVTGTGGGVLGYMGGASRQADWQTAVLLTPFDAQELKRLGCTEMPILQDNR